MIFYRNNCIISSITTKAQYQKSKTSKDNLEIFQNKEEKEKRILQIREAKKNQRRKEKGARKINHDKK